MKGESGIPPQVCPLACIGHRSKAEVRIGELALDTRDSR